MKKIWLKRLVKILFAFFAFCVLGFTVTLCINSYIKYTVNNRILTPQAAGRLDDIDCIVVLGCWVDNDGVPCDMLTDRLLQGIDLYKRGAAPKLLMSGDHGHTDYDEVNSMKKFAIDNGIPSSDVFMDHAGFSTYESLYRAKDIFKAKKVIIVTQEYHLYRAVYIANHLGLNAYGVASDQHAYIGQTKREVREVLARVKDFFNVIVKPEPTYLGEAIPVYGNGDLTNDS